MDFGAGNAVPEDPTAFMRLPDQGNCKPRLIPGYWTLRINMRSRFSRSISE